MYSIGEKYFYEILDDYKDAESQEEKSEIIESFMGLIWASNNKRRIFQRDIRFSVSKSLLDSDLGRVFNSYTLLSYTAYRSMTKETDFVSLIRQKLNNIYTNQCDGKVCLKREYMDLLKLPKKLYYRWRNGEEMSVEDVTLQIDEAMSQLESVKEKYAKQKINISWNQYKKLVKPFFERMFENYIPLENFEDKSTLTIDIDTWNEDNFAIAYFCKGLDGYMKNYQKEYYGLYVPSSRNKITFSRCECGGLFVQNKKNNKMKCDKCGIYQPIGDKVIHCIDCGNDVVVNSKANNTMRCEDCRIKEKARRRMNSYYKTKEKDGLIKCHDGKTYLIQNTYDGLVARGYFFEDVIELNVKSKNYDHFVVLRSEHDKNCTAGALAKLIDYNPDVSCQF